MGFDLYGLKPNNPNNAIKPEQMDWSIKHTRKEKDVYFKAVDDYECEVIGSYFRNNVWWWRPLWTFIGAACDDILTEKDMSNGNYNDGHKISKTKALKIAARLRKLDKQGVIDGYEETTMEMVRQAHDDNKKLKKEAAKLLNVVKKETGNDKIVPMQYPTKYRKKFDAILEKENWSGHYPFYADNVREFSTFCQNSGGFEIC